MGLTAGICILMWGVMLSNGKEPQANVVVLGWMGCRAWCYLLVWDHVVKTMDCWI